MTGAWLTDPRSSLQRYLQNDREALLWKLDGLAERDRRWPATATGVTLAGIVKHCANVEIGYLGLTFGREWSGSREHYVALEAYDDDPQADWYLPEGTDSESLSEFYREVWRFADETVASLPLDATGAPPWWGEPAANQVSLHHMLLRVIDDTARHAGQADVIREGIDGAAGLRPQVSNLPGEDFDWTAYRRRLEGIAEGCAVAR